MAEASNAKVYQNSENKEIFVNMGGFYTKLINLPQENSPLRQKVKNWWFLGIVFITF